MATAVGKDAIAPLVQDIMQTALKVLPLQQPSAPGMAVLHRCTHVVFACSCFLLLESSLRTQT